MIEPLLAGDALLAEIERPGRGDQLSLWWLGQSGFLLRWRGHRLLMDPYLSDSLTRKYADTPRPHVRMTSCPVSPELLRGITLVTSSHNHTDHLDRDTLLPVLQSNPDAVLVVPEANRAFVAERLGIDPELPIGLDDGLTTEIDGISVTGVPAAHEELDRDAAGRHRFLGYVARLGPWTVYHSGDTVRYDGMVERLRPMGIDLALLPINGRAPERGVAGNLDGAEAARLAREIGAAMVIPCHYEMFTFNTASPASFIGEAERIGQPARVLRCGERWSSGEPCTSSGNRGL